MLDRTAAIVYATTRDYWSPFRQLPTATTHTQLCRTTHSALDGASSVSTAQETFKRRTQVVEC